MIIQLPICPVMEQSNNQSQHVDEVLYGDSVQQISEKNGYCLVHSDYGYEGFVSEGAAVEADIQPSHWVVSPFADILPSPENYYQPMLTVPRGSRIAVDNTFLHERYAKVILYSGAVGYIHKEAIRVMNFGNRQRIVNDALSYMGTQYRWGGRTPEGIDCSGLCFMAYRMNGFTIWRDALPEKNCHMNRIEESGLKPADLLFYPGHVAMYIGDGKIVHSTGSRNGVHIADYENWKDVICRMTYKDLPE